MGGGRKTILSASDRAGKISNPHIDEAHTDTVAEIQNTLRAGADVKMSEIENVTG